MSTTTIDPSNGRPLATFEESTPEELHLLLDGAHTLEKSCELLPNVMQIIRIRHSDNLHHSLTARPEELKITARRFFVWRTHENF